MTYYIAKLISKIICLLPERFCHHLGVFLGKLTWKAVPKRRREMSKNQIITCLKVDEDEAERIAKASWVQFGPMLMEVLRYPVLKKKLDSGEYVEFEGWEKLQKLIDEGTGGVIATCHSDSWELMGAAIASHGARLVGVAKKQKQAAMDRFINEYRTMVGMHITYSTGVREMFDMIKDGWFIGLIMDQDPSIRDGIILRFFDQETNVVTGPAVLSRFQGTPIMPAFITKLPDGRHRIRFEDPIYVAKTKDKRKDIADAMQQLMDRLEAHIKKKPEEWFWLHDRWKSIRNKDKP